MRDRCAAHMRLGICGFMGLLALAADPVRAQQGTVRGIVIDSAGKPIKDADIGIVALRRLARSDDQGRFTLANVQVGPMELSVRRLSYQPRKVSVHVRESPDAPLLVKLEPSAAALEGVEVTATYERRREGIEDFNRRRVRGVGTYFSRDDILSFNTLRTSDVLRRAPGIRLVRVAGGVGIRFNSSAIVRRDCIPMIWLDGQQAPSLEIDDVPASDIEGIELYNGPSTTPLQFSQRSSSSTCGTIAVWTRNPGL